MNVPPFKVPNTPHLCDDQLGDTWEDWYWVCYNNDLIRFWVSNVKVTSRPDMSKTAVLELKLEFRCTRPVGTFDNQKDLFGQCQGMKLALPACQMWVRSWLGGWIFRSTRPAVGLTRLVLIALQSLAGGSVLCYVRFSRLLATALTGSKGWEALTAKQWGYKVVTP